MSRTRAARCGSCLGRPALRCLTRLKGTLLNGVGYTATPSGLNSTLMGAPCCVVVGSRADALAPFAFCSQHTACYVTNIHCTATRARTPSAWHRTRACLHVHAWRLGASSLASNPAHGTEGERSVLASAVCMQACTHTHIRVRAHVCACVYARVVQGRKASGTHRHGTTGRQSILEQKTEHS